MAIAKFFALNANVINSWAVIITAEKTSTLSPA